MLFLITPQVLSAQTWEKVWHGAQKTVLKPGLSLQESRAALRQARKELAVPSSRVQHWLEQRYAPMTPVSVDKLNGWAALSNRLMLRESSLRKRQLAFFNSFSEGVPEGKWQSLSCGVTKLAQQIGDAPRVVLVGSKPQYPQAVSTFKRIVLAYKSAYPKRKIIVFSEALSDKGMHFASPVYGAEEHLPFIKTFTQKGIEVVGLGDASANPQGYLKQDYSHLILPAKDAPASVAVSSAHMRRRLAQWRTEYPDAVFFVYTLPLASAYDVRHSLANRFAEGDVFSVSLTSVKDTRDFLIHRWNNFKLVQTGIFAWTDPEWARMSGFDAQVILP